MKILIKIKRSPEQLFLVGIPDKRLNKEIRTLINKKSLSKAIAEALSRGRFERELTHDELPAVEADLILTEKTTSWNLTK